MPDDPHIDNTPENNSNPPTDPPADPPKDGDDPPADPPKDPDKAEDPPADDGAEPEGGAPAKEPEKKDPPADDNDDEDEEKRIAKMVDKRLSPFETQVHTQRVNTEVEQILQSNPEYKPYEAKIRRFVNHENRAGLIRQGLPVKTVVLEAIAPHLQQIGAAKAKAADEKAAKTRVDGSSARPNEPGKLPDFANMKASEIEDIAEQVRRGTYNKGAKK